MREFKFRAWDIKHKLMYSICSIHYMDNLMQYTELKTKSDTEIYEEDILSFVIFDYEDNDTTFVGKVVFSNGSYIVEYQYRGETYRTYLAYILSQDDEAEVIGNTYENPELLETK